MKIKILKNTGHGKCGVAVIRVSGKKTKEALKLLTNCDHFKPRYAMLKQLRDIFKNDVIDTGLVLWFPEPNSFTGEDVAEFQVHGGPAVVKALLSALGKIEGLRPSEPGEFSKRAFLNGKMDLIEAEGIADLIHAETELQRKQALLQAEGHLSKLYQKWRTRLIRNIAHLEAYIDFSEDENIEEGTLKEVHDDITQLRVELKNHLNDARKGERLKDGVRLAIVGATNVGKSSLMNTIVQRDLSIVTNIQGTTRDVIESTIDINGYPLVIMDTAGLRKSDDIVETEGINRAKKCAQLADIVIIVIDGKIMENYFEEKQINLDDYRRAYLQHLELSIDKNQRLITIINKADLISDKTKGQLEGSDALVISCTRSIKITDVIDEITSHLQELCGNPSAECPYLSQERHRFYIQECLQSIEDFLDKFNPHAEQDLAILVQTIRDSVRSLSRITGEVRTDDILDVIFKDFCIGK